MMVFNNGTNVVEVTTHTPVSSGGTGAYTLTANNVILGNGTSAVQFVAPGTSGNVLTSNGTTWASTTPVVFVTGMIILWSGSIASIPSGWALCDGTNGTPNLEDRFVVGAGNTYAVNATGGSADAIVVSHTHTATSSSSVTDPGHGHTYGRASGIFGNGFAFQDQSLNGTGYTTNTATTGVTVATSTTVNSAGSSGTNANLPPYYALAYIMKL
jgi:microcystin-dependent protein